VCKSGPSDPYNTLIFSEGENCINESTSVLLMVKPKKGEENEKKITLALQQYGISKPSLTI